jgi:dipeptidyl aminopeptidase/acylaminoacyl peptidase
MFRINYILLFLFLAYGVGYSEQGKVKIVLENGYYYTQLETGEKFEVVKQHEPWAFNKIVLSPDEQYVAYTTSNGLGFESEGRDIFYCKVDGSEKTFLHKFRICVDTLLWESSDERTFIFVIPKNCAVGSKAIAVIDVQTKNVILDFKGDSLLEIQGTDCYKVYYYGKPLETGRQKICLEELSTIKEPIISNASFFTSWIESDIYISTQREPVLRLRDLSKLAEDLGKNFEDFVGDEYFYVNSIVPSLQHNHFVFIGEGRSIWFFGVFDLKLKKLLLFDYAELIKFSNPTWSPDGRLLAFFKIEERDEYIDFYEIDEKGGIDKIESYKVTTDRPISDFRWSSDSKKFYYSYLFTDYQKVETEIDLTDK